MRKIFTLFLTFSFLIPSCFAYEFVNPSNKSNVYDDVDEIYSLKNMYEEMAGISNDDYEIEYEEVITTSDSYWWPIGSEKTIEKNGKLFAVDEPENSNISSSFGYRDPVINSSGQQITGHDFHSGTDIANYKGVGVTNVIASKSGVVVFPLEKTRIDCTSGDKGCTGYGNYIVIQHADGNYTLYAHLHANTINVRAGDTVEQGQVIAKVGTSGNSTGPHLHFEVRVGENKSSACVEPTNYVNKDNPRPVLTSHTPSGNVSLQALLDYINEFEGVGCWGQLSEEGNNYVACMGNDNVITIGHGVVWEANRDRFISHGISNVQIGSRVSKEIINAIELDILDDLVEGIRRDLAVAGIDGLKDYQIYALASQAYNGGYTVIKNNDYGYDFITNWKKYNGKYSFDDIYKHQGSLWYDSLCRPYSPGSDNQVGLQRRRVSEWMMFNDGTMDHLEQGFDPSKYAWPE